MLVKEVLIHFCIFQCLTCCHVSVLCLLGHELALVALDERLKIGLFDVGTQRRTEPCVLALLTKDYTALALIKGIAYFIQCRAKARPDAHSCDYNSSTHIIIFVFFFLCVQISFWKHRRRFTYRGLSAFHRDSSLKLSSSCGPVSAHSNPSLL